MEVLLREALSLGGNAHPEPLQVRPAGFSIEILSEKWMMLLQ